MTDRRLNGRLSVKLGVRTYTGDWQVVGERVEVTSELGTESAPLGQLRSAAGTVAREKLVEMARAAERAAKPRTDTARFNIRDA